jgi:uncharacterized membrane protein (DUF4010 family)
MLDSLPSNLLSLAVAVGLGLLVGLQREWATDRIAGIRTFPIVALAGALVQLLAGASGSAIALAAGVLALAGLLVVGNLAAAQAGQPDPGMTTEVAALAVFLAGAAVMAGYRTEALLATGCVTVLLQAKARLHTFVGGIAESELRAVVQLVLVALVILPLLPDRAFGAYGVLNPFRIWLMVVLIVAINLGAYVLARALGGHRGALAAGLLGGLISSTATTVSLAQRSRNSGGEARSRAMAAVILIASTVVFARVLVEIALVHPAWLRASAPPLLLAMAGVSLVTFVAYLRGRHELVTSSEHEPPSSLRSAIVFGALYAAILFAVAAAREHLGSRGLYTVAFLSGLTDMDAITLSTAQLVKAERLDPIAGWRLVLLGGMANLAFKAGAVAALGAPALRRQTVLLFLGALVWCALVWWLGPALVTE